MPENVERPGCPDLPAPCHPEKHARVPGIVASQRCLLGGSRVSLWTRTLGSREPATFAIYGGFFDTSATGGVTSILIDSLENR